MKKDLFGIFDEAGPAELDRILRGVEADAPDEHMKARIRRSVLSGAGVLQKKRAARGLSRGWKRAIAAAAAAVFVTGAALGTGALAEAAEYRTAKTFLDGHDILSSGLTRQEVKAVYSDISSGSFELEKTAEVLTESYMNGYSEERVLCDMWFYRAAGDAGEKYPLVGTVEADGSHYCIYGVSAHDLDPAASDANMFDVFVKERMGSTVWGYELEHGEEVMGFTQLIDGVAVMLGGEYESSIDSPNRNPRSFIKLDNDGRLVWRRDHEDFPWLMNAVMIAENDGGFSLLGEGAGVGERGNLLEWYRFSSEGELTKTTVACENDILLYYSPARYARFGDGCAVLLERSLVNVPSLPDEPYGEDALILLLDENGSISGEIRDEALLMKRGERDYFLIDSIQQIGDRLYISGTEQRTVPAETFDSLRDPETNLLSDAEKQSLVELQKANHTAVLLVYDPADGSIEELSRAEGCMGRTVHPDPEGGAIWDLCRLASLAGMRNDPNDGTHPDAFYCNMNCVFVQRCLKANGGVAAEIETLGTVNEFCGYTPSLYDETTYDD